MGKLLAEPQIAWEQCQLFHRKYSRKNMVLQSKQLFKIFRIQQEKNQYYYRLWPLLKMIEHIVVSTKE